jgi:Ca2+-binding RTX toxin-like protein
VGTANKDVVTETSTVAGQPLPTQHDDVITGLAGGDTLFGLGGADLIQGGRGRDALQGGAGDDALLGRRGSDVLDGGEGDDTLVGGLGKDRLTGGEGNDAFVFTDHVKRDRIADFEDGDVIHLSQSAFAGLGATGILDAEAFHVGSDAETGEQRVIYDEVRGLLLYAKHGSETKTPFAFARIDKGLDLDHTDFLIV